MIKRVVFTNFKQFDTFDKSLKPSGVTLVAGANNSGKSSLLHGLAVWEFAKLYIEQEKGRSAFNENQRREGVGISNEDFTPINIPSLKYLWTNLTGLSGYRMKIRCYWDLPDKADCFLEISFSLVSERLYMKATSSNLTEVDKIPSIAYLPPFAGITDREQWYSNADRRKLAGRGLAGSILRNTIIDMFQTNEAKRKELKGDRDKIPARDLDQLRETDPYEKLNTILFEVFKIQLHPQKFNPNFHNYVKIDLSKGQMIGNRYSPFYNYNKRDIMVEGSGFLQWLSVYTYALDLNIDVLLLDEPDAHLHTSLQTFLFKKLSEVSGLAGKQIFMATHSPEIIRYASPTIILKINRANTAYLQEESQKAALIAGLGSEYSPILNTLQRYARVLFMENASDCDILKQWFRALGVAFPDNLVVWPMANKHDQRKQLFIHLKDTVPGLRGISLEDRDNFLYEQVNQNLCEPGRPDLIENNSYLRYRKWRRWEIENYLIHPAAISRAANIDEDAIRNLLQQSFGIVIQDNFLQSDRTDALRPMFDVEGKAILNRIEQVHGITKFQIASVMSGDEIFADARTLVNEIINMCTL